MTAEIAPFLPSIWSGFAVGQQDQSVQSDDQAIFGGRSSQQSPTTWGSSPSVAAWRIRFGDNGLVSVVIGH